MALAQERERHGARAHDRLRHRRAPAFDSVDVIGRAFCPR
jgi:hypothetical protein